MSESIQDLADLRVALDLILKNQGSGLTEAASNILSGVQTGFGDVYSNTYGNLKNSVGANESSYYYSTRSQDLYNVQNNVLNNVNTQTNEFKKNHDTALRQQEINQWANSDKLDTLFVFQFLFISLMLMTFLGYLWRINILSSGFLYFFGFLLIVINIMIIVIRSKYTRYLRNTRYWNRRKFNQYPAPPPLPLNVTCDSVADALGGNSAAPA